MANMQRRPVPPELAAELKRARQQFEDAQAVYDATLLRCLKAGASFGEMAAVLGLSKAAVSGKAARLGWPPPELRAEREAKAAESKAWRQRMIDQDQRPASW